MDDEEELGIPVLKMRKSKPRVDPPDTLTSMANLGSAYSNRDSWDEVENSRAQVYKIKKTKFGVDHSDTLIGIKNLSVNV
jgi:hypothetical protein